MERINNSNLSEEEKKQVRALVSGGKVVIKSFDGVGDLDLLLMLRDSIELHRGFFSSSTPRNKLLFSYMFYIYLNFLSADLSPRFGNAVFVLCREVKKVLYPIGTAFAITTPSQTIAMTCAHCLWSKNEKGEEIRTAIGGDIVLTTRVVRGEDGHLSIHDLCYYVKTIYHNTLDICLLQIDETNDRNQNFKFENTIPICPKSMLPVSSMQEYVVKLYHAPITLFSNLKLPSLEVEIGAKAKAGLFQGPGFYIQSACAPGSSGGPVINTMGQVVGMLQSGWQPTLPVEVTKKGKEGDEEEIDEDDDDELEKASVWTGTASNSGNISFYAKIIFIAPDEQHHAHYAHLLAYL